MTLAPIQQDNLPYRVLTATANTDEWLQLRKLGVGASESAAILGDSVWGTPYSIWQQKTAANVVDAQTDLMQFGHLAEPLIVQFLENHADRWPFLGEIIESPGLLQSKEWPWLLGTLDRRVRTPTGEVVPLELKSVNDFVAAEWKVGGSFDGDEDPFGGGGGERFVVPPKYVVQVQQQMAVTGDPFAYVAAWLGKSMVVVIRVDRDDAFITEMLVGRIGDFWHYFVETGEAPPASLNDDLWSRWPGSRGVAVDATADVIDLVGRFRIAGADARDTKKELEQLKFEIAVHMGDATELVHPTTGDVVHTLRGQNTQRKVDYDRLAIDFPDAYEACVTPPGWTRVHRPTKATVDPVEEEG